VDDEQADQRVVAAPVPPDKRPSTAPADHPATARHLADQVVLLGGDVVTLVLDGRPELPGQSSQQVARALR
jgi:hypothetical protein